MLDFGFSCLEALEIWSYVSLIRGVKSASCINDDERYIGLVIGCDGEERDR